MNFRLRWMTLLVCSLIVVGAATLFATPAVAQSQADVASLGWLTGGTWVGTAPGSPLQVKTEYSWSNNKQFVRFFTKFVMPSGTQNKYDGNFYFDPATHHVMTWYVHEDGAITLAETTVTPSGFAMTFSDAGDDGHPANYRVEVARQSDDRYSWRLFQQTKAGWKAVLALTFVRQA
ncbi:MAG TPA: hypothetical protein VGK84_13300 [Candidatus Tumulicola sp.]|jgi:hypothetical protein